MVSSAQVSLVIEKGHDFHVPAVLVDMIYKV